MTNWFIPLEPSRSFDLTSSYWTGFEEYPPLRPDDPSYRLTERLGYHGEERVIPRESWEFGRMVDGAMVRDPSQLYLWTGFRPGYTYQLTYESSNPQVIGVGFAAIRDAAAYFKFDPDAEVRGEYAYAYGVSQTGRYLRQLIHEGFTVDETGGAARARRGVRARGRVVARAVQHPVRPPERRWVPLADEVPDPLHGDRGPGDGPGGGTRVEDPGGARAEGRPLRNLVRVLGPRGGWRRSTTRRSTGGRT